MEMIRTVIKHPNKMVTVLDRNGEQIPGCQDLYEKVKECLLKKAPPDAIFYHAFETNPVLRKVKREAW